MPIGTDLTQCETTSFCINDTTDDAHPSDPRLSQVRDTLARLLPVPSCFEKAAAYSGAPANLAHRRRMCRV